MEDQLINFRPHNVSLICLGTFLLWFGWLGFNAGSAFGANLRAIYAAWNSNIMAAAGGIVWCALDYSKERKYTVVGFCSGTIAGLVAATPSSGFVPAWGALIIGSASGAICNYATKLKYYMRVDDSLDVFAEHAVGGVVGLIGNAIFAADYIISLDDVTTTVPGGWIQHNWKQMYKQLAYVAATMGYTFVMTVIIAKAFDLVPFLRLRADETSETIGMDDAELGEFVQDFVELRRHYDAWVVPIPGNSPGGGNGNGVAYKLEGTVTEKPQPNGGGQEDVVPVAGEQPHHHHHLVAAGDRHGVPDTSAES
jgi:Amt family ammonium transporter